MSSNIQHTKQAGLFSSLTPGQKKLITSVAIALGVSAVALTAIYFGNKFVRSQIASQEENKTLGQDKHATWAKQIKNAFDNNGWWGTDEVLLRNTLREIPSKEDFKKVQKSYKKQESGGSLIEDMTGELKQTEYNEMLAIINSKPEKAKDAKNGAVIYDPHGWAKRLNAAVNYNWLGVFWGTDDEAITAVVSEFPSQKAFLDTSEVYMDLYGTALMEDLRGDLDPLDIAKYRQIILNKPRE